MNQNKSQIIIQAFNQSYKFTLENLTDHDPTFFKPLIDLLGADEVIKKYYNGDFVEVYGLGGYSSNFDVLQMIKYNMVTDDKIMKQADYTSEKDAKFIINNVGFIHFVYSNEKMTQEKNILYHANIIKQNWLKCYWSPHTRIGKKHINKMYDENFEE